MLTTESKRFDSHKKALVYFTRKMWGYLMFTLVESWFDKNGNRVKTQKTYRVYDGVAEEIR